jgi:Uma2 family endonuclease
MGMPAPQPPAAPPRRWTVEEVRAMQDESRAWPRYELIGGELLVTPGPAPRHQRFLAELFERLLPYVKASGVGGLLWSPADIELDDDSIVQPDIFVVPRTVPPHFAGWREVTGLVLAVEVISPESAKRDRGVKRDHFQRHGVPEYWIVDLDARLVERWRPEDERPEVLRDRLPWRPDVRHPALELDLPALFAAALGDEAA